MTELDWARLSDSLVNFTIVVYALALLGYGIENAFGRRAARAGARAATPSARERVAVSAAPDTKPGTQPDTWPQTQHGTPQNADPGARSGGSSGPAVAGKVGVALTVLGAVLNAGAVVTRGLAAGRVPWGNMYEFAIAASLVAVVVWLVVLTRSGPQVRRLGGFVILPVILLLGIASLLLYVPAGPLVPALNSSWLMVHVAAAIIATGTFLVSFVASVLYLLRSARDRADSGEGRGGVAARLGRRLPAADQLDRLAHRTVVFAFPVWTFAVVAGAIWAESAWGRFWGWDPKETWSAISWLVYAGYLHARATAGWSGRRAAWISILGFTTMMINLFGVNFVVSGLHSYA